MSISEGLSSRKIIMINPDDQLHHMEKHRGINKAYPECGENGIFIDS